MIPNQQNQKERKPETGSKRKLARLIIPLIVMLMLICIIAICVVGAHSVHPTETAELNKDVEPEEEHISAAVDIAATSIGTNVKATFTVSTGDIYIYNSSSSGADATISKSSWYTFLKKIITADGNLDAVKSITFNDRIYAPTDSSRLFYPSISNGVYPLSKLTTINNLDNLNMGFVNNVNEMFTQCSSLVSIDGLRFHSSVTANDGLKSAEHVFHGCKNLKVIDLSYLYLDEDCSVNGMVKYCSSLVSFKTPRVRTGRVTWSLYDFVGCTSLVSLYIRDGALYTLAMNEDLQNLRSLSFQNGWVNSWDSLQLKRLPNLEVLDMSGCGNSEIEDVFIEGESGELYEVYESLPESLRLISFPYGLESIEGFWYDKGVTISKKFDFILPVGVWYDTNSNNVVKIEKNKLFNYETDKNQSVTFKKAESYVISYNLNGGTATGNPTSYSTGGGSFALNQPTKPGCKFLGWTGSNGTTPQINVVIDPKTMSGNLTYTANWQTESASYQVRHWKQNINGNANTHDANNYTLANTENKTGPIGTSVTPPVNTTYTGFNTPATQTKPIAASGTVIDYWYTRKSFTVALNRGTGISSVTGANTYLYGANVTIDATVSDGYTWLDWTGTQKTTTKRLNFTMPAANVTYTANATPNTNTRYIVRHWQQKVNGNAGAHDTNNYTLVATENKTGTTGANVTPPVKSATEYVGFIPPGTQTKAIAGNGGMVIDYYYARQSYTVSLNKGTGINTVTGGGSYLYGANVTINATLLPGYSWKNWTGTHQVASRSHSFTMPAGNVTDTANATIDTYRITYNLNGGEVSGNPESYTAETASFTLVNPTKAGYTFTGWTGSNGETALETVTISKGSIGDRNYIANWVANTDTPYMVRHWKQNIDGKADQQNEYNYTIAERKNLTGT
ncbi:MAG: hypothetical protein HFJ18_00955, partial [Clostridia bacterium]|nr:hypothetical protein [Clostridia bacterium]